MCEVEIKDESSSNDAAKLTIDTQGSNDNSIGGKPMKLHKSFKPDVMHTVTTPIPPPMSTTSFDVLNLLRNSSFGTNNTFANKYSDDIQLIVEMQTKEHAVRMDILRAQLDTAKLNRDIAEINKILLLRNLQANGE